MSLLQTSASKRAFGDISDLEDDDTPEDEEPFDSYLNSRIIKKDDLGDPLKYWHGQKKRGINTALAQMGLDYLSAPGESAPNMLLLISHQFSNIC